MDIGEIEVSFDEHNRDHGRGFINTLKLYLDPLLLTPDDGAGLPDSPTHRVEFRPQDRQRPVKVGVAWKKTMQRGKHAGKPMYSLALTDPDMPEWARNLAAFPTSDQNRYRIVYDRPRQGGRENAPGAEGGGGANPPAEAAA